MFQHVVRWTFLITIWKKYKRQLFATLFLVVALFVVSLLHQDYLSYLYTTKQQGTALAWSFAIKWIAYLLLVLIYSLVLRAFNDKDIRSKSQGITKQGRFNKTTENKKGLDSNEPDPFANIRTKSKLKSKADYILDETNNKNP